MYKYIVLIHVLAATVWTGGQLILSLTVLPKALRNKSLDAIKQFEETYEKVGITALIFQLLTGIYLGFHYMPDFSEWFAFKAPISHMVVTKITLLVITAGMVIRAKVFGFKNVSGNNLKPLAVHIIILTVISVIFVFLGVWYKTGSF